MTCLVTGGKGFIGSYVVRDLIRRGESVIAHDAFAGEELLESLLTPEEFKEVSVVSSSADDFTELARLVIDYKVESLVHMVSMLHPASNENPPLAERVNNLTFINALEAARLWKLRLVWASSVVVYGSRDFHPEKSLPNDAPHHPTTVYAACKSYNEFLANHYRKAWDVDHIGLRFTLVYGPGRTRGASSFINRMIQDVAQGRPVVVPFGDDEVDWQYVEDISRLVTTCLTVPSPRTRIFNTRCDVRSIRNAGAYLEELMPQARIAYQPGVFGIAWELDDSALRNEIGFEWEFRMETGVKKTVNHYRMQVELPAID